MAQDESKNNVSWNLSRVVPRNDQLCCRNLRQTMNCTALSAAVVALLVAVIAVSVVVDGYSPTSTKFDWSPNRNSQDTVRKGGAGKDSSVELAGFESGSMPDSI